MNTIPDEGFQLAKEKKKPVSKDPNPEAFWRDYGKVVSICKLKAENPKWGSAKIIKFCKEQLNDRMVRKYLENYFYDLTSNHLYKKSVDLATPHRKCLLKEDLINLVKKNHALDHRKSHSIYESIRRFVFPVVRENVKLLFDLYVDCDQCKSAISLPKTERTRRPIPATYPNSRWQIDLKKMPPHKGFQYICNIVDCFSRFAFGQACKTKSATEISKVVLSYIYLYGAPRILQSDNGKEFRNSNLKEVVDQFDTVQMHGRPYHPQSQGRVERFNRTLTEYFRIKMSERSNWSDQLPEFYYAYNNRLNKATRPKTPYQLFFTRPNFAVPLDDQVPYASLTKEERDFLEHVELDVDENESEEELPEVIIDVRHSSLTEASDGNQIASTHHNEEELTLHEAMNILDDGVNEENGNLPPDCTQEDDFVVPEPSFSQTAILQENVSPYYKQMYQRKFYNEQNKENVQVHQQVCDCV
ncbi:unnamed protein product [Mytilus edulis]|uniref:Integrase catalytic domain-containing protein n=1 Tax=Mytilus edulis TaxID=6550 RepID=A0A8S3UD43_MYTED|nr:unnamed protein product [Mytilus edulis]